MKNILIITSISLLFACTHKQMNPSSDNGRLKDDTTPRVTGIGGIFFYAEKPSATQDWYAEHLGMAMDAYGSVFEFRNANRPEEINYMRWSIMAKNSNYMSPSPQSFMINYRVNNLEGLIKKLRQANVSILDTMETYDYGKFIHIMDPEGNKIELWEPVDSVLTKMGSVTTK